MDNSTSAYLRQIEEALDAVNVYKQTLLSKIDDMYGLLLRNREKQKQVKQLLSSFDLLANTYSEDKRMTIAQRKKAFEYPFFSVARYSATETNAREEIECNNVDGIAWSKYSCLPIFTNTDATTINKEEARLIIQSFRQIWIENEKRKLSESTNNNTNHNNTNNRSNNDTKQKRKRNTRKKQNQNDMYQKHHQIETAHAISMIDGINELITQNRFDWKQFMSYISEHAAKLSFPLCFVFFSSNRVFIFTFLVCNL